MRTILALLIALPPAALPACVFASGNKATARDVEKPSGDPRVPESQYVSVAFDATGASAPIYETPPDRALVIHDLRTGVRCDLVAEVAGAPMVLVTSDLMEYASAANQGTGGPAFWSFRSPSGVKVPAGAKARLQRTKEAGDHAEVVVFFSGELVRL